jgi:hypothetical protein
VSGASCGPGPVAADDPGHEAEGLVGQRQRGTVMAGGFDLRDTAQGWSTWLIAEPAFATSGR